MKRVKKIKKVLPKDESFQIWKNQSSLSVAQRISY